MRSQILVGHMTETALLTRSGTGSNVGHLAVSRGHFDLIQTVLYRLHKLGGMASVEALLNVPNYKARHKNRCEIFKH